MNIIDQFALVPTGVLTNILSYVPDTKKSAEALAVMALVSKRFNAVSGADILWKPVADKYVITIDQVNISKVSVKAQVKDSIERANELGKKLMIELPESLRCTSLATYPLQKIWDSTISTRPTDFLYRMSRMLSAKELLPDSDVIKFIQQMSISLKYYKSRENTKLFETTIGLFNTLITHLAQFKQISLLKNVIDLTIEYKIAGTLAIGFNDNFDMNPLLMIDPKVINLMRNIVHEGDGVGQFILRVYDTLVNADDVWSWIRELPELEAKDQLIIFSAITVMIAKHMMQASREWPDPSTVLTTILNQIKDESTRDAERIRLQPLFGIYIEEYTWLTSSASVKKLFDRKY